MTAIQLERLKKDYEQCEQYAKRLKKRGDTSRFSKLAEKMNFLNRKIAEGAA
jgi:uncharacterized protein YdcH (DUF465 family)